MVGQKACKTFNSFHRFIFFIEYVYKLITSSFLAFMSQKCFIRGSLVIL